MKRLTRVLPVVLALAFTSSSALAQTPAAAGKSSLGMEISQELADVEKTPAEKFGWRPAEGVRSVSEVYVHVAGGNYLLPSVLGAKRPENTGPEMEKKIVEKDKVIEGLKASFDHARQAVEAVPDSDLDKTVKFFRWDKTERQMLLLILNHAHEHLGQSIAYARMNGIAPPWSEGPPPAASEKKPAAKS
jgi:uncharacterized damage-inducible protein DinB